MKKQSVWIYMNNVRLEKVNNRTNAEALIRMYERQDRYEVEVEGYQIPAKGYPVYEIKEA